MEVESALESIGLTKNEIKVYLALLDLGLTTTSAIIKRVGINTSKVYESLDRLLKKGLVSYTIIRNKKNWQAEEPSRIETFLEEEKNKIEQKQKDVKELLPMLKLKKSLSQKETQYKVYEGIKGIKTARENVLNVLKEGETFYIILSSYPQDHKLEAYWEDFQQRRVARKIKARYLLNETLRETGEKRKKLPYTEINYVSSKILSPTWIEIYGEYAAIGVLSGNPSIFVIKNKNVADGFKGYFENLCKISKK